MRKVSHFLKGYWLLLSAAVVLMFVQTLGTLYIPTLMSDIVNNGIMKSDLPYIYSVGAKMLLTALVTVILSVLGAWTASGLASGWGSDIRESLFDKTQKFSLSDFNQFGTASMITRCTNDVAQLQDTLIITLQLVIPAPLITIGGLLLAYQKNRQMALLIVGMIIIFLAAAWILCKKAIPLYRVLRKHMDDMNRTLREQITGVRVIRAFNCIKYEQQRIDETFQSYGGTSIKVNKIFAVMMPIVLAVINLCSLCILWFGGQRVTAGIMGLGDVMALIEYALLIFWNLVMGVAMLMLFPRASASAARINEVLSVTPDIADGEEILRNGKQEIPAMEFCNVTFRYGNAEEPVLSHLNFRCFAGQTTAIIGGTGSGKSTIANLMMRFYDIQEGAILLNGQDIRSLSQASMRDKIGFVPQKAFLFSGSIADNLRYGNRNAGREDFQHAAAIAQAADFIAECELGYDSYVSQGGGNFSGGQKQRLCIARALMKKAAVYIFDDSFSALDFKTDARLRAALKREVKDAAIIVVAQRVSSILDADQIVVLDEGGIAAIGTHEELLKTCDIYREIVASQRKEEVIS